MEPKRRSAVVRDSDAKDPGDDGGDGGHAVSAAKIAASRA